MQGERMFAVYGWSTRKGKASRALLERFWLRRDAEKKYPNAEVLRQPSA